MQYGHHVLAAAALFDTLAVESAADVEERRGKAGLAGGCPVAAATVDCAESTVSPREAAAAAFATWTGPVARALAGMGVPEKRTETLATLVISSLEGAILIARAERDVRALTTVAGELGPLLDAAVSKDD